MKLTMQRARAFARPADHSGPSGLLVIQILYVVLLSLWAIWHGSVPSPEMLLVLVGVLFMWRARDRALLRDLLPFVFLLICYQGLRGFADNFSIGQIHSSDLITYERALFGGAIPAIWVQAVLGQRDFSPLLDLLASGIYMLHFVVPVLTAIGLWYHSRTRYHQFVTGLLLLSYAAFITYILYPAAPPWWAAQHGHLPESSIGLQHSHILSALTLAGPNPVAAMPSLHAGYSVYLAAFCIRLWGPKAAWVALYPFAISFSTLYLGHHYVVDLLAGAAYAFAALGLIWLWPRVSRIVRRNTLIEPKRVSSTLPEFDSQDPNSCGVPAPAGGSYSHRTTAGVRA